MCVNDLCRIINAEKVFTILNNAICFDEQELHKACWHFIERYASDVVSAESFNNITLETLMTLVNRDKLDIPEVKLFQAVLKWSEVQCEQQNLTPTAENKKSVMGDAIYAIKYLSRSQKDFAQHVSRSGLFSDKELVSIYGTLNGLDSALEWSPSKRKPPLKTIKVSHNNVRFNRFNRGYENEWRYMIVGSQIEFAFLFPKMCYSMVPACLETGKKAYLMLLWRSKVQKFVENTVLTAMTDSVALM
jgi:hypothetical protein